ncbi:MAG: ribulose-phosphate 3-epimerase [Planctomycetota bacterium]
MRRNHAIGGECRWALKYMSRRSQVIRLLSSAAPAVLPSFLQCNFGNLEQEIARLEQAHVAALHLDVMDGVFVPNLTYGMPIVAALRKLTQLPLDVHLMIERPQRYLRQFRDAGADVITVHWEAVEDAASVLAEIRSLDLVAGLAINPATPVEKLESLLPACDLVLVMSVPAGFGGQSFDPTALDKLQYLRERGQPDLLLEVDGGVNDVTIGPCVAAGAQLLVVGSAIFKHSDYQEPVSRLSELAGCRK